MTILLRAQHSQDHDYISIYKLKNVGNTLYLYRNIEEIKHPVSSKRKLHLSSSLCIPINYYFSLQFSSLPATLNQ